MGKILIMKIWILNLKNMKLFLFSLFFNQKYLIHTIEVQQVRPGGLLMLHDHYHWYQDNCWPMKHQNWVKNILSKWNSKIIVTIRPSKSKPSNPDRTIVEIELIYYLVKMPLLTIRIKALVLVQNNMNWFLFFKYFDW